MVSGLNQYPGSRYSRWLGLAGLFQEQPHKERAADEGGDDTDRELKSRDILGNEVRKEQEDRSGPE